MRRNLDIGDVIVSKNESIDVWSVLGSCIAIIFYVKDKISIISHTQISSRSEIKEKCIASCPRPCFHELDETNNNKFVKCTLEYMISIIQKNNIDFKKLNTTIVGGAFLMERLDGRETVGEKNIKMAKEILRENRISIDRELTGGEFGYNIWYNTKSDRLIVSFPQKSPEKFELVNKEWK